VDLPWAWFFRTEKQRVIIPSPHNVYLFGINGMYSLNLIFLVAAQGHYPVNLPARFSHILSQFRAEGKLPQTGAVAGGDHGKIGKDGPGDF
jgi:hypothetical protein